MNNGFHNHNPGERISLRDSIENLRQALDLGYARLRERARNDWERNFVGEDPSDACVSVRVTAGDSPRRSLPCAGVIRQRRPLLTVGGRPLLA
jgi:hypothetical protein